MGCSLGTLAVSLGLSLVCLAGCNKGSADTAPSAAASATAAAPASAAAAPAAPSADALDPQSLAEIADQIVPKGIPTARSKPPSVAEWNAASEITVRYSGPLGCETKRVREWLRVSCRTSGSSGPHIQSVRIVAPTKKDPEFFTFERKGVASIVLPLRQGMDAKIEFTWTARGARVLAATWPKGAPAPGIYFDRGAEGATTASAGKSALPKCEKVCGGARGFPSACATMDPCPAHFKCLENHICICTIPCED